MGLALDGVVPDGLECRWAQVCPFGPLLGGVLGLESAGFGSVESRDTHRDPEGAGPAGARRRGPGRAGAALAGLIIAAMDHAGDRAEDAGRADDRGGLAPTMPGRGDSRWSSVLDEVAKQIIAQLQQDGDVPTEPSARPWDSEAAVRQRMHRLTQSGVMQIVAVTDPISLGPFRQAMIAMKVDGPTRTRRRGPRCHGRDQLRDHLPSKYNVLCEVVCNDDAHLVEVHSTRIRAINVRARWRRRSTSSCTSSLPPGYPPAYLISRRYPPTLCTMGSISLPQ